MTDLTLSKPNATLVMMPKAGKLTAIERKLLNSIMLSSVQQLAQYRALHNQDPLNTHFYSAHADELLDPIEVGKSNLKSVLRKMVLSLRRAEIDWEAPDAKVGTVWSNLSMLSQAKFELRGGHLYVLWALPPEINKALSDTQDFPFTKLDLEKIALLKSYTAVALYELCARYRNNYLKGGTGECLTSANPPNWWVDALTNTAPKIDKLTSQPIRREWRKVKNEAVKKAIEEINQVTDLEIELREKRKGKAVDLVQFVVRQKKAPAREISKSHYEHFKVGVRLGITEAQIESAIARTSTELVGIGLAKLEARTNQSELPPIENVARYFTSILGDMAPLTVVPDREKVMVSPVRSDSTSPETSALARSKEDFMALPEGKKKAYAIQALEALAAKGIATERIRRNAAEGVWSGMLLSQMIEIFARSIESQDQQVG
jgi:hypothetical protein